MNRILSTALLFALAGGIAVAQAPAPQSPAPSAHKHHDRDPHRAAMKLSKRLNLTPDQTAKVEPIIADRQQKISALKANTQLTPEDRKKQIHAIHQETEQQLAGILTPDQLQQLKSMRHGHHGHKGNQPATPAAA
jgi:Spy/CpxP family protein refolding chaperone